MDISKQQWAIMVIVLAAAVLAALLFSRYRESIAPAALPAGEQATLETVALTVATSTAPASAAAPAGEQAGAPAAATNPLPIGPSDSIASWDFKGAYAGNEELSAKARSEVARLTGLLGTETYSDYSLYVSIANQYDLLGDGASEFAYLKKALILDPAGTGLAWHNAGQLLARLGAYASARTALERAVAVQPIRQYHQTLLDFLTAHYPEDTFAIDREIARLKAKQ